MDNIRGRDFSQAEFCNPRNENSIITGENLNQNGIIEITVANTAANEITAEKDLIDMHSKAVIGPYYWHERSLEFEKNVPTISFGIVKICKLK